jgi:hypothetical protein
MSHAYRVFVLSLALLTAMLPLAKCFDCRDTSPLPTDDTELYLTALLAVLGLVFLLAKILAPRSCLARGNFSLLIKSPNTGPARPFYVADLSRFLPVVVSLRIWSLLSELLPRARPAAPVPAPSSERISCELFLVSQSVFSFARHFPAAPRFGCRPSVPPPTRRCPHGSRNLLRGRAQRREGRVAEHRWFPTLEFNARNTDSGNGFYNDARNRPSFPASPGGWCRAHCRQPSRRGGENYLGSRQRPGLMTMTVEELLSARPRLLRAAPWRRRNDLGRRLDVAPGYW